MMNFLPDSMQDKPEKIKWEPLHTASMKLTNGEEVAGLPVMVIYQHEELIYAVDQLGRIFVVMAENLTEITR